MSLFIFHWTINCTWYKIFLEQIPSTAGRSTWFRTDVTFQSLEIRVERWPRWTRWGMVLPPWPPFCHGAWLQQSKRRRWWRTSARGFRSALGECCKVETFSSKPLETFWCLLLIQTWWKFSTILKILWAQVRCSDHCRHSLVGKQSPTWSSICESPQKWIVPETLCLQYAQPRLCDGSNKSHLLLLSALMSSTRCFLFLRLANPEHSDRKNDSTLRPENQFLSCFC